jgi:hypothetical protein
VIGVAVGVPTVLIAVPAAVVSSLAALSLRIEIVASLFGLAAMFTVRANCVV